ncbi:MAG: phosphomannomutase, partial [candidate division NC10 bacterium]|nr:phosphomannomutase [candidate division NC10 bacterium]
GKNGWGLIRASNTEPALILRFEASSQERMQRLRSFLENQLTTVQRDLGVIS